jgi:hypothetical protein
MKVSVRLVGDGLRRADALANDVRTRAIAHLEARRGARADRVPQPEPPKLAPSTR